MSCQIRVTACINDIPQIRRCLFPTDDLRGGDTWLQSCKVSISPTGDVIAFANNKRLVLLTGRWDANTKTTQYQSAFDGCLNENDPIKAVLCLPIVAISQSSQVTPDWTCIVIGYESGYVRFYTENCTLLFEEQLHDEPVIALKCQSQHSSRPDISTDLKPEEIYVIYNSNVCIVDGPNLIKTLRTLRSQLARGQGTSEPFTYSTILKKWGFSDQETINDVAVAGLDLSHTFDHLFTASTNGGFDTKYRAMAPRNTLILAAGAKPFVGFHYALEGGQQPLLSDVAKTMKSILKTALPFKGWLGSKTTNEKPQTMQPVDLMGCRFGLCDIRRSAVSIILTRDQKLAACTDALGRVSLIDVHKGVVLRIFKGTRDAQCAFIQVPDEGKSKRHTERRIALFLIIYSQKKATLEIYSAQQGNKIATFTSSKFSRLFYITHGLMGFETTSKSKYICSFTTLLMDNDGLIKEIVIPFHFALTEKNSKRARDLHLFKRLKQLIKTGEYDEDKLLSEAYNTTTELKTTEIKLQCLEMLITSKEITPEILLKCVDHHIEKIGTLDAEEIDPEIRHLKVLSENVNILSHFYKYSTGKDDLDAENGNKICEEPKTTIGAKEMSHLQKLLDLSTLNENTGNNIKVSFNDNTSHTFSEFLSMFDITKSEIITLKEGLAEPVMYQNAETIFESCITEGLCSMRDFQTQIKMCKIDLRDLFRLLLTYWVDRSLNININLEKEMNNLSTVIYALSVTVKMEDLVADYNSTSPFWTEIRNILADSSHPFPALMAAILCKSVAQKIEFEKDLEQSSTSLEEDMEIFEKLSQESCQWTMLIGKLEDISLLNIILANKPLLEKSAYPKLKHEKRLISLKYIMENGKGSVSELVAQWLTSGGISPNLLIANEKNLQNQEDESQQAVSVAQPASPTLSEPTTISEEERQALKAPAFEHLNLLKRQFPYSLDVSVLLVNMTWEYARAWQKDIQDMQKLDTTIKCLASIPNVHLKKGLFNLVWNTHLKITFESSCKLLNKVGKLPKERLCLQDTGLTDGQLTMYLRICSEFFDAFMNALEDLYQSNTTKQVLKFEPIWENGPVPIVELAMTQNDINYQLLHLHHQLSICFLMVATFSVKSTKLIQNLFDFAAVSLFFTDLQNRAEITLNKNDSKLNIIRSEFLKKIISATIDTVRTVDSGIYSIEHVKWVAECLSLARVWGLDVDVLKRYQVIELYNSGFDSLAEELLPAISEPSKVAPDLLVICGRRLCQLSATSDNLGEWVSVLSPAVTSYIDKFNGQWCAPSTISATLVLANHCVHHMSESQPEYKTAIQILEACLSFEKVSS